MLRPRELKFEVVTPLYLGGADASLRDASADPADHPAEMALLKADTRIRVRPIVASWRRWFRIVASGIVGWDDRGKDLVREAEMELFGGIGPSTASRLRVALREDCARARQVFTGAPAEPVSYLGFGLGQRMEQRVVKGHARYGIEPGEGATFLLEVVSDSWHLLEPVIRLSALFAGLGARHRRGLGSVRLTGALQSQESQDLGLCLAEALTDARSRFRDHLSARDTRPLPAPTSEVLHPDHCSVKLASRVFRSYRDALKAVRNQLRASRTTETFHLGKDGFGWRQRWPDRTDPWVAEAKPWGLLLLGSDHDAVDAARRHGTEGILRNDPFGLPIAYPTWHSTVVLLAGEVEVRKPSSLSFRILKVSNNDYRVLIVLFNTTVPERFGLFVKTQRHGSVRMTRGATSVLTDFFNNCVGEQLKFT